jgi:catechol 2,3-dioxygenase-like lactoylglutathione lyase family enzyme
VTEPAAPPPGAVLETCLYAADLAAAEGFYAGVLGLEVHSKVAGRFVFFRCGAGMFLVFDPAASAANEEIPPHGAAGPGHACFAVPEGEMDAWRARLEAAGVAVESDHRWPRGGRSLYVRDPAGNCVELASPGIWRIPEADVFRG